MFWRRKESLIGKNLGAYRILDSIGAGDYAEVFRAERLHGVGEVGCQRPRVRELSAYAVVFLPLDGGSARRSQNWAGSGRAVPSVHRLAGAVRQVPPLGIGSAWGWVGNVSGNNYLSPA